MGLSSVLAGELEPFLGQGRCLLCVRISRKPLGLHAAGARCTLLTESLPLQASLPVPRAHFSRPPNLNPTFTGCTSRMSSWTPLLVFSIAHLTFPLQGTLKRKGEEACWQPLLFKHLLSTYYTPCSVLSPGEQELDGVRHKSFKIPG